MGPSNKTVSGLYRQYRPAGYDWADPHITQMDLDLARWRAMGSGQREYFDKLSREAEARYDRGIINGDFSGISPVDLCYTDVGDRDGE